MVNQRTAHWKILFRFNLLCLPPNRSRTVVSVLVLSNCVKGMLLLLIQGKNSPNIPLAFMSYFRSWFRL